MFQIYSIMKRELKAMMKEKSFVLILMLEIILVSASSFMSLGYVIFTSPESSGMLNQLSTLIYVGVVTDSVNEFTEALEQNNINYRFYGDYSEAKADFKDGVLDAVIQGDVVYDADPSTLTIYLPSNSPKNSLTRVSLKKALMDLEQNVQERKVEMHAPDFETFSYTILNYAPHARYIEVYYIFTLPLILFLPALVAGSLAIDSITQELEEKSILNLLMAPVKTWKILVGKNLSAIVASIIQCVAWIAILDWTSITIANKLQLVLLCLLYSIVFVNLGSIISLIFREMKSSQIIYTVFSISSISLYSPMASTKPLLLENSPAYLLAQTSLGFSMIENMPQLFILIMAVLISSFFVFIFSKKLEKPL